MRKGAQAKRERQRRALPRRLADAKRWLEMAESGPESLRDERLRAAAKATQECETLQHRIGVQ